MEWAILELFFSIEDNSLNSLISDKTSNLFPLLRGGLLLTMYETGKSHAESTCQCGIIFNRGVLYVVQNPM